MGGTPSGYGWLVRPKSPSPMRTPDGPDATTRNSDHLDQILRDLGTKLRRRAECAPAQQDFDRFEGEGAPAICRR